MVQLADSDILTREVLSWRGIHLLHGPMSTCSQKVRIVLNTKGIAWSSHPINLAKNENLTEYFLGINPRGLVPVLIDDGRVQIESNDIILYIEDRFPTPVLIPAHGKDQIEQRLGFENDLHHDLRALSFRFMMARSTPPKSSQDLQDYRDRGSGTVKGAPDKNKQGELDWWLRYNRDGVSAAVAIEAALRFRAAFSGLERTLSESSNLLSEDFSVLDVAWLVYVQRLRLIGYPVARLHPQVFAWFERHLQQPLISKELAVPADRLEDLRAAQQKQRLEGTAFENVCAAALV